MSNEEQINKGTSLEDVQNENQNVITKTDNTEIDKVNASEQKTEINEKENQNEKGDSEIYGAPENYDFKKLEFPEGIEYSEEYSNRFANIAKELNLSQNSANKIANLYVEILKEQAASAPEKIKDFKEQIKMQNILEWEKELNSDKEIGVENNEKFNAYMDKANIGYKNFASEGLKNVLKSTGLDHHPEMIKLFYKLSNLTGEDKILSGKPTGEALTPAEILYGSK